MATLGEEDTGIRLAVGKASRRPRIVRRAAFVLLQSLLPYILQKLYRRLRAYLKATGAHIPVLRARASAAEGQPPASHRLNPPSPPPACYRLTRHCRGAQLALAALCPSWRLSNRGWRRR